jgi:hypothetical protein
VSSGLVPSGLMECEAVGDGCPFLFLQVFVETPSLLPYLSPDSLYRQVRSRWLGVIPYLGNAIVPDEAPLQLHQPTDAVQFNIEERSDRISRIRTCCVMDV